MSTFKIQKVIDDLKERPKFNKLKRQPVYRKEDYIVLIKKHYKECGLPEPDWLDEIPDAIDPASSPVPNTEPKLFSHDWVSLVLEYDETRECVSCRLSTALHDLYRDYYAQGIPPPIESLVRAYKDLGFSDEYLMRLIDTHDRRIKNMKKVWTRFSNPTLHQKRKRRRKNKKSSPSKKRRRKRMKKCMRKLMRRIILTWKRMKMMNKMKRILRRSTSPIKD